MYKLFLLFIIYSFTGWSMEVIFKLIQNGKLVNRGFLVGPLCPIYGFCGLSIYLLFENIKYNPVSVFVISILTCAIFEYFVSWLLEKLFHARWWDYSHKRFNLNGRICLRNLLFFGVLGCLLVYYINPFLTELIDDFSISHQKILAVVLFILFTIDTIMSVKLVNSLKNFFFSVKKDATEEISKKIIRLLIDKSIYFRRVIVAYPNFRFFPLKRFREKIKKNSK